MMLQKTNFDGYVKDPETNAVLNTSQTEYQTYMMNRARAAQMKKIETDINNLKNEMCCIREELKTAVSQMTKIMAEIHVKDIC